MKPKYVPQKAKYAESKFAHIYADSRWKQLRAYIFNQEPLCRPCRDRGFETVATQLDHIKPLPQPNPFDSQNVQPICDKCHHQKTQKERYELQKANGAKKEGKHHPQRP